MRKSFGLAPNPPHLINMPFGIHFSLGARSEGQLFCQNQLGFVPNLNSLNSLYAGGPDHRRNGTLVEGLTLHRSQVNQCQVSRDFFIET